MRLIYPKLSANQHAIVAYIHDNPGCSKADVDRAVRRNPHAGHRHVYDSINRLIRRGIVEDRGSNRCQLYLPQETEQ